MKSPGDEKYQLARFVFCGGHKGNHRPYTQQTPVVENNKNRSTMDKLHGIVCVSAVNTSYMHPQTHIHTCTCTHAYHT